MEDVGIRCRLPSRLELTLAITTRTCRRAQEAHSLLVTSAIALGRLLTSTALLALSGKHQGTTSVQVICRTTLRQLFADANHEGHLRGFAKNPSLAFPLFAGEEVGGRRSIAPAVKPGEISVVRARKPEGTYVQSTTPVVHGEIDEDLEFFLEQSDQVPTAFAADALVTEAGAIARAGGVLVQALPDGDRERIDEIRAALRSGEFCARLKEATSAEALLYALAADAQVLDRVPLAWQCRCSIERVLGALRLLEITDLAEMIEKGRPAEVHCDLCGSNYSVETSALSALFEAAAKARG